MTQMFQDIMAYKGVHALCTAGKEGRLQATHFAMCLIGGSSPVWAVYTAAGKFLRYHSSKSHIASTYPHLVWRRQMATWGCVDIEDKPLKVRKAELAERIFK